MEADGYVVFRNWTEVPDKVFLRMNRFSRNALPIFNAFKEEDNDSLRRQRIVKRNGNAWIRNVCAKLPLGKERRVGTCVVLRSDAGCKAQVPHCDFVPNKSLRQCSNDEVPGGFLIALQDNTCLDVWPGSHKAVYDGGGGGGNITLLQRTCLNLNKGDAVFFRGDLIHAGCGYSCDNIRLHFYLDCASVKRPRNITWTVPLEWCSRFPVLEVTHSAPAGVLC